MRQICGGKALPNKHQTKGTSSAFFYQFRMNIRHNRYLVKSENPFVQHKCISSTVGIYSFFFRRFSKISWSRRASRSSSARFFSANSRMILS